MLKYTPNDPKQGAAALWIGSFPQKLGVFALLMVASLLLFSRGLTSIIHLALNDEKYSYLLMVPFVSIGALVFRRRQIFAGNQTWPFGAIGAAIPCLVTYLLSLRIAPVDAFWQLSLGTLAVVLFWIATFVGCFGLVSAKAALFPLSFLILFVPIPPPFVSILELALQRASAELSYVLMRSSGMPVFRDGLKFLLPGIEVEVARECSGIRSSIGLTMAALVLGHLFLGSLWKQVGFVGLTIPILIFKNAFRIALLSWLGVYISRDVLIGALHHHGGPLFALIGLAIQIPLLFALQRLPGRTVS